MAPAEPHLPTQRVAALLASLSSDDERLEKPVQSLQKIRGVLAAVELLVACYGNVFGRVQVFDSVLDFYEDRLPDWLKGKKHSWNSLVRRRSSHGEELKAEEDVAVLSREIVIFIVQFVLRCNARLGDGSALSSPLWALFRRLDNLKMNVGALKSAPVQAGGRPEVLRTYAAELKETWECLCVETGLPQDQNLCATDLLAPSPSRFWVDAWWHATSACIHRPVPVTKPIWDWGPRKRSKPGMAMASIKLNKREYFLETYRRSSSKPKTVKWAGRDEQGHPIILEHKLSVPDKETDLIPHTPHGMYLKDRSVRFPGTQEVVVKDQHDRIIFDGTTGPEYCFLDAKYSTQFHQDLRGRKAVACVDVQDISSDVSAAHSMKMYLWRDTQSSDIHFHTLSYYSHKEPQHGSHGVDGRELEFPLLWLHGTAKKESSTCLLFHFQLEARSDGEKRAAKRHSGLSVSLPLTETRSAGDIYVPPVYKAFLAKYKSLTVNFGRGTDCDYFKEVFEKAHYEDSLVHLLHCLPLPNLSLRPSPLPSIASSRSTNSFATARSSGSSSHDWFSDKLSPTWLHSAADPISFPDPSMPITEPSKHILEGPPRTVNNEPSISRPITEETTKPDTEHSTPFPDGHPGNMI
ncbi:uncharacterized protein BDR25DRAFT_346717 [Lindgomyces ingoldianus]|uniref:Uncharacterized protein n=1 Tax=Lindgomyces ingoldianus TaxID=673940 RepID=A0ACB6QBU6_9PLEO|nr:uncharacterized protein BDR25DRAFT_346717 [Lindgomyces ingoldianus]KAF2464386.1 hypothetical protein BDR25DRAFT_346717 [Lindgomyces ingoldianus]